MKIPNMKLIEVSYIDQIVYDNDPTMYHLDLHLLVEIIPGRETVIVISESDPNVIRTFEIDPQTEVRIKNEYHRNHRSVTTLEQILNQ